MNIFSSLKSLIPLFIVTVLGFFLWRGLSLNPKAVPSPYINKPVPEFNVASLQDPDIKLNNALFTGHVSLLNVWATWCPTCAVEYPVLMDIAAAGKVDIIGLDYKDHKNAALKWLSQYGNPFKQIGFDASGTVAIDWGVYGTPETFVVDKKGMIRYKVIGAITPAMWHTTLLPLVEKLNHQTS